MSPNARANASPADSLERKLVHEPAREPDRGPGHEPGRKPGRGPDHKPVREITVDGPMRGQQICRVLPSLTDARDRGHKPKRKPAH
jgi:hypothetical protein